MRIILFENFCERVFMSWFGKKQPNSKITWEGLTEFSVPGTNTGLDLHPHFLAAQVAENRGWRFDYNGSIYEEQDTGSPLLVAEDIHELASFGEKNSWFKYSDRGSRFIHWSLVSESLEAAKYPLS